MSVSVPTVFPLYRAGAAEVIDERGTIDSDPDVLHLIDAVTYAYAVACRPLLLSLSGGDDTGEGIASSAASGGSRELVASGLCLVSADAVAVQFYAELEEADVEVQVWDEARGALIDSANTTQAARLGVTLNLDVTGYDGTRVLCELYVKRRAASNAYIYHAILQETALTASELPL